MAGSGKRTKERQKMIKNNPTMKFEFDPETGKLNIDVLEYLREIDEEAKAMLVSDGGWWAFIEKEMIYEIINAFSREHYAPEYTKIRAAILNSEAMPKIIHEWAETMTATLASAKAHENYWNRAYWNLYHSINDRYRDNREAFHNIIPELPKHSYGKEYAKELLEEVNEQVKNWSEHFPENALDGDWE